MQRTEHHSNYNKPLIHYRCDKTLIQGQLFCELRSLSWCLPTLSIAAPVCMHALSLSHLLTCSLHLPLSASFHPVSLSVHVSPPLSHYFPSFVCVSLSLCVSPCVNQFCFSALVQRSFSLLFCFPLFLLFFDAFCTAFFLAFFHFSCFFFLLLCLSIIIFFASFSQSQFLNFSLPLSFSLSFFSLSLPLSLFLSFLLSFFLARPLLVSLSLTVSLALFLLSSTISDRI